MRWVYREGKGMICQVFNPETRKWRDGTEQDAAEARKRTAQLKGKVPFVVNLAKMKARET